MKISEKDFMKNVEIIQDLWGHSYSLDRIIYLYNECSFEQLERLYNYGRTEEGIEKAIYRKDFTVEGLKDTGYTKFVLNVFTGKYNKKIKEIKERLQKETVNADIPADDCSLIQEDKQTDPVERIKYLDKHGYSGEEIIKKMDSEGFSREQIQKTGYSKNVIHRVITNISRTKMITTNYGLGYSYPLK
jgi:hypothetical protein